MCYQGSKFPVNRLLGYRETNSSLNILKQIIFFFIIVVPVGLTWTWYLSPHFCFCFGFLFLITPGNSVHLHSSSPQGYSVLEGSKYLLVANEFILAETKMRFFWPGWVCGCPPSFILPSGIACLPGINLEGQTYPYFQNPCLGIGVCTGLCLCAWWEITAAVLEADREECGDAIWGNAFLNQWSSDVDGHEQSRISLSKESDPRAAKSPAFVLHTAQLQKLSLAGLRFLASSSFIILASSPRHFICITKTSVIKSSFSMTCCNFWSIKNKLHLLYDHLSSQLSIYMVKSQGLGFLLYIFAL